MLQAAMRVSFTSPKVMHWITESLWWLYEKVFGKNAISENEFEGCIENIAKNSVKKNLFEYISKDSGITYKNLGVQTRHIAFNYLDYLLWKENKVKYDNFIFEYRNSVEHWYPQNPSGGTFEQWPKQEVDHFGNLCIIQRNVNSKFSNLEPHSKKATFEEMISKGSIKLRLMAEKTKEGVAWKNEYEKFYTMAENSQAFKTFCKDAFGEDFSQDGFSNLDQIRMILPYVPKRENVIQIVMYTMIAAMNILQLLFAAFAYWDDITNFTGCQ